MSAASAAVHALDLPRYLRAVSARDGYACAAGITCLDLADPAKPRGILGPFGPWAREAIADGAQAFMVSGTGIEANGRERSELYRQDLAAGRQAERLDWVDILPSSARLETDGLYLAAASGTVIRVRCNAVDARTGADWGCDRDGDPNLTRGCGWYVDIAHPGGIITRYCHMQTRPAVNVGDPVIAGQPIGEVGSTGHSSGPHLHFAIMMSSNIARWSGGTPLNPYEIFKY